MTQQYQSLDPIHIVATVEKLSQRIAARFPDASLHTVCVQLLSIAQRSQDRSERIGRPLYWMRGLICAFLILFLVGISEIFIQHPIEINDAEIIEAKQLINLLPLVDSCTDIVIVLGATLLFLVTLETRVKRSRALAMIRELRSIAHIIDMHQLSKDPERVVSTLAVTDASPQIDMTPAELVRYLDYCSEMLALTGKLAALYVQNFNDMVALAAVNEVESLTTGLSRKIWQKMMVMYEVLGHSQ